MADTTHSRGPYRNGAGYELALPGGSEAGTSRTCKLSVSGDGVRCTQACQPAWPIAGTRLLPDFQELLSNSLFNLTGRRRRHTNKEIVMQDIDLNTGHLTPDNRQLQACVQRT